MRLLGAFLTRDFYTEVSYRASFVISLFGVLFSTFLFYFLSEFIGPGVAPALERYGGDYFAFVLIGIAFSGYFTVGLTGFSSALRQAQMSGTLEAMLMTPTSLPMLIVGSALWSYLFTTLRVVVYLLVGTLLLGTNLGRANYLGGLVALVLAVVAFASIGIIAASVIMVIKRGDPITGLFGNVANLIGGVFYPVEILPEWLQVVARLLPITYALDAMRLALLSGASWREIAPDLLALLAFCVILFPMSLMVFRFAVQRARQEGTLTHY